MAGFKKDALSLGIRNTHPTAADVEGNKFLLYVYSDGEVYKADENGNITQLVPDTPELSGSGQIVTGVLDLDTSNDVYTIAHTAVDLDEAYPLASLIIPASGSAIYVQGLTNRTTTSFDVVLSEVPVTSGYQITWALLSDGFTGANGISVGTQVLSAGSEFTPDVKNYSAFEVTLTGNITVNLPLNMTEGTTFSIALVQDDVAGRTATWNDAYLWASDTPPSLSAGAGATDIISVLKINGKYYGSFVTNMS